MVSIHTTPNQWILDKEPLEFQWSTMDPFLFCVHHLDYYPESNGKMGPRASLAGRNIGNDFEGIDGWRMYHGRRIPGFPAHPHRGFETVTIVRRGFVDHADSMGAKGRYGEGDLQWMTAGAGVQHSEMFPLLDRNKTPEGKIDNTLELFQIWLNLPSHRKFARPYFTMHWREGIPRIRGKDSKGKEWTLHLYAGSFQDQVALPPPPDSWASDPKNYVWIWVIELSPGAEFRIPSTDSEVVRNLYYYSGQGARVGDSGGLLETGILLNTNHRYQLPPDRETRIRNGENPSAFLLLQGRPIGEPVFSYGPFVMNSYREIQMAYEDYRATGFGGWPWGEPDIIHGEEGRFALYPDGRIESPERIPV